MEHWIVKLFNCEFNMDTIITMWLAMAFVIIVSICATRKLSIFPSKLQLIAEGIMGFLWNQTDQMIGNKGRTHIPFVASLFLFILVGNLMGQVPLRIIELKQGEFASPTNDINLTAALAVLVLIYYLVAGIKERKIHFLYHGLSFAGIIETFVDFLDMITRPFSLALRLFCNIFVGEILVSVVMGICIYFVPAVTIMPFEIFVAFVQALVFTMLTISYISMAVNGEE